MKNISLYIFSLILISTAVKAVEKDNFSINANIVGIQPGDKIIINQISLPEWNKITSDTIFASSVNHFSYGTTLYHSTLLMISHLPYGRDEIVNDKSGKILFAKPFDTLTIIGDEKYISSLSIRGGSYDMPDVRKLEELSNKHDSIGSNLYRQLDQVKKTQNKDSIKKYQNIYNGHRRKNDSKKQKQYIINEINDNEYSAYLYLQEIYDAPYKEVTAHLSKYSSEVQQSYMGQQLYRICKVLKNIEVGNTPPDFTLIDSHKNKIRLSDYQSRYVLIYHFGVWCPGTQWVHPKIDELYKKYHTKGFDIIGLSVDKMILQPPIPGLSPELSKMLYNQPWVVAIANEPQNKFITDEYYFSGVPILMLISPDGKTLVRGYSESIEQIKEILDNNLNINL